MAINEWNPPVSYQQGDVLFYEAPDGTELVLSADWQTGALTHGFMILLMSRERAAAVRDGINRWLDGFTQEGGACLDR